MKKSSRNSSGSSAAVSKAVASAIGHHQAGRFPEAEIEYGRVLSIDPKNAHALHFLGVLAHQSGQQERAVALITDSLAQDANNAFAHNNLGAALFAQGNVEAAIACYHKTLALQPDSVEAHYNLARAMHAQGKVDEAIAFYRKLIALQPAHVDAYNSLGQIFNDLGRREEAIACFQKILLLTPDLPEAHNNLGSAYTRLGRTDEALACYRNALAKKPDFAEAWYNLGYSLSEQGNTIEAIAAYQRALSIRPDYADASNNLGNIFHGLRQYDEAVACFQKALLTKPDGFEIYNNLGSAFFELHKFHEAETCYLRVLDIKPESFEGANNMGKVLMAKGQMAEATDYFQKAVSIGPDQITARGNLLMSILYQAKYTPTEVLEWHRAVSMRFEKPFENIQFSHTNIADPERRLKIGYVSADFNQHAVARFAELIIERHDRNQVEVFCYCNSTRKDEVTERFSKASDHWRVVTEMSDALMAARVKADGIDILIDLSGHTSGNRLPAFAGKPAPIQITYLGYGATTGLAAMDYRLTHIDADPIESDAHNSEILYRLPRSLWCYRPSSSMPAVTALPALENGYVTFGVMNGFHKVSPQMIAVWAEILRLIPTARLVMVPVPATAQQAIHEQFAALGITQDRIALHGRLSSDKFWDLCRQIDIALDPFPYNGGTTTCETFWLGVPLVTLTGQSFVSRLGYTLLKSIGLPELAAKTEAEYVEISCFLARDLELMTVLRAGMRQRMAASPLCDEAGFVRSLEAAYRDMWRTWCSSKKEKAMQ